VEGEEDVYFCPSSQHVENVEDYRPGGFHPLHLGESFDKGRFKVVHKHGSEGYATVWLTRDTRLDAYVALKILQADRSTTSKELQMHEFLGGQRSNHLGKEHIAPLLHYFLVAGPNRLHTCLVSPIAGPSMRDLVLWGKRFSANDACKVAHRLTQALVYLHSVGVCHGGKH
jgi:serine/threonine-protein kinase SRPK3